MLLEMEPGGNQPSAGSFGNCEGGLAGLFKDLPVAAVPKDLPGASPVGVGVILDALVSMIGSSRGVLE